MSTVLWANVLVEGQVVSDQTDHGALYKHAEKLDALARGLGLSSFLEVCDTTDQRFNVEEGELPAGMTSTDELMAAEGAWMPAADAVPFLQALRPGGHLKLPHLWPGQTPPPGGGGTVGS